LENLKIEFKAILLRSLDYIYTECPILFDALSKDVMKGSDSSPSVVDKESIINFISQIEVVLNINFVNLLKEVHSIHNNPEIQIIQESDHII